MGFLETLKRTVTGAVDTSGDLVEGLDQPATPADARAATCTGDAPARPDRDMDSDLAASERPDTDLSAR